MSEWNRFNQDPNHPDEEKQEKIEGWKQYDANEAQEPHSFSDPAMNHYQDGQSSFYRNSKPPQKIGKGNGLKVFAILMCIIFVFVVLVFVGYVVYKESSQKDLSPSESESSSPEASMEIVSTPEVEEEESYDLTGELSSEQIADKVMPSVVGVVVYTKESAQTNSASGEGSGIIMSSDGYIITNAHVVLQESSISGTSTPVPVDKIEIYLNNEEYCQATLIGVDVRTDLAVVKIEKENLVAAEFGDSTSLKIGEKAIAIGNPTGRTLSSSFTQGVISGVDRVISIGSGGYSMSCIQTDAAINPGNSGGALVNKFGQVVGINSSKIAATEYEGIGFAIPVHEAKPIIDNLIKNGYVSGRVRIGIVFQSIPQALAELRGTPAGLRVVQVDETTDAYTKGVQAGDIITKIDGQDVVNLKDVSVILNEKKPGDTVSLTIYRAKDSSAAIITVEVELQEDMTGKIVS